MISKLVRTAVRTDKHGLARHTQFFHSIDESGLNHCSFGNGAREKHVSFLKANSSLRQLSPPFAVSTRTRKRYHISSFLFNFIVKDFLLHVLPSLAVDRVKRSWGNRLGRQYRFAKRRFTGHLTHFKALSD